MKKDIESKNVGNLETEKDFSCGWDGDKVEIQNQKENRYLPYRDKKARHRG